MPDTLTGFTSDSTARQLDYEKRLLPLPQSDAFRDHLLNITRDPHPAGTEANLRVAEYLAESMEKAGLKVDRYEYDVYIPEPGADIDVALVTPIRLPLNNQEYVLKEDPFSAHPDLLPGWNAFSGSGDVTAPVVYANYGRKEDFEKLEELGVSVKGKIVIARFGGNFRGHKVRYAEAAGAIGVVMFTDPSDGGYTAGTVYPEGKQHNESAVQRGSLLTIEHPGDPLTPFEPAYAQESGKPVDRKDPEQVAFHTIPAAPLPYGSAVEILKRMTGSGVPSGWQGGLPITYRVEGGEDLTVRLRVDQPRKLSRAVNVVGTLEGSECPDEWIILGCHYDAWAFGTVDPNSGTAMLLTLADALGKLAAEGHRPKRSIKIGHWDAEEINIIGSTEWVEQLREEITEKAIAYVNADMAAGGPNFGSASAPALKRPIIEATKAVAYPGSDQTVYEHWRKDAEEPSLGNLGGGSDHIPFYMHVGVPSAGMTMSAFSPYHTNYDDFAWYERFSDPEFTAGPTVACINGVLASRLANADVIPYDLPRYATDLDTHIDALVTAAEGKGMSADIGALKAAVASASQAALAFEQTRDRLLSGAGRPEADLGAANRKLVAVEKAFIHMEGLQGRPWFRSLYAADNPFDGYAAWMLPGLCHEVEAGTPEGLASWLGVYTRAVDDLAGRINAAAEALQT
jgi:N-acetylated-alpha-linked acidic dipeptidase